MSSAEKYQRFLGALATRKHLGSIIGLCGWDEQVNLPSQGVDGRAEQMAALSSVIHQMNIAPDYVDLVRELAASTDLNADQVVIVRETKKELERSLKVPADLVSAISRAESKTYAHWVEARKQNSFASILPDLEKLFQLKREYAAVLQNGNTLYDVMLDLYEPGLTVGEAGEFFADLRPGLSELLGKVSAKLGRRTNPFKAEFSKETQRLLCQEVSEAMGFDYQRGRLDEAVHPFCAELGFDDIRMTTRYRSADPCPALYGTMHEAGHALYELGYRKEYLMTPLAQYCSMAIHESQSRLWENMIGRSDVFLRRIYPRLQELFRAAMEGVSYEVFFRHVNWVSPTMIRVEADEVSYGLHIIIRFELERELVSGALAVKDLPEKWNEKYASYLGVKPDTDAHGVLQDVHWYTGNFGYFPTYLLGSAYAAQILNAARKAIPAMDDCTAKGEFTPLRKWLNENIHQHGKRYTAGELMQHATGERPHPEHYLKYLNEKFGCFVK